MEGINVFAVLVAAASSFVLGGLWYSPMLFGRLWNREAGQPQVGHPAKVFTLSFIFAVIAAGAFASWLGPRPPLPHALTWGRHRRRLLRGGELRDQLPVREPQRAPLADRQRLSHGAVRALRADHRALALRAEGRWLILARR
jgi:hypothetical protein